MSATTKPARPIGFAPGTSTTAGGFDVRRDLSATFIREEHDLELPRAGRPRPAPAGRIIPIQNLKSAEFALTRPLHVVLEESADGLFSAGSYDLDLAGVGHSEFDALDDLREQIIELVRTLREHENALGKDMQEKLVFLRQLMA
jgi:hypothetical protein